jgi:hypothetical protein
MRPPRIPLDAFPDVLLHADELAVKRHPQYAAAKGGDSDAAEILVDSLAKRGRVNELNSLLVGRQVVLLPVHALESEGVNEIPAALAERLSEWLGLPITESIVQSNTVGHTGASGFQRLANLIGYVEAAGGHALGATVLTGKPYSAKLSPDRTQIEALRSKHGRDLENWWRERFGFGFDCLTRSEARYLENSPDAQAIRDRLVEAGLEGGSGASPGGPEPLVSGDGD